MSLAVVCFAFRYMIGAGTLDKLGVMQAVPKETPLVRVDSTLDRFWRVAKESVVAIRKKTGYRYAKLQGMGRLTLGPFHRSDTRLAPTMASK